MKNCQLSCHAFHSGLAKLTFASNWKEVCDNFFLNWFYKLSSNTLSRWRLSSMLAGCKTARPFANLTTVEVWATCVCVLGNVTQATREAKYYTPPDHQLSLLHRFQKGNDYIPSCITETNCENPNQSPRIINPALFFFF